MKKFHILMLFAAFAMIFAACSSADENSAEPAEIDTGVVIEESVGENENSLPEEAAVDEGGNAPQPGQEVAALNGRAVFFAHNSVGQNILDGVREVDGGIPIFSEQEAGAAGIAEVYMGFNGDPDGKMDAFRGLMDAGGNNAQIAFFKLCYADFDANTNATALFDKYASVMTELEAKYPDVTFAHVTAPLYHYNASYHNSAQHAFNEKMRSGYGAVVFDLAALEAVDSSGAGTLSRDGVTPAMAEEWSLDGSHLNEAGGKYIAGELIQFLANVPLR